MKPAAFRSRVLRKFAELRALYPKLIENRPPDMAALILESVPHLTWAKAVGHLADKSQDAWTADEWRAYAHTLEFYGAELATDLERTSAELTEARRKLSRKTADPVALRASEVLLGEPQEPKRGRGRPENKDTWHLAMAALFVKGMARERGESLTDRQALAQGRSRERAVR